MRTVASITAIVLAATSCVAESDSSEVGGGTVGACGEDVPALDWESFGQGFVTTYCQGCHASTALDRHGAPAQLVFDTEGDVLARAQRIIDIAGSDAATMPPAGGPDPYDREALVTWLRCATEQ